MPPCTLQLVARIGVQLAKSVWTAVGQRMQLEPNPLVHDRIHIALDCCHGSLLIDCHWLLFGFSLHPIGANINHCN